MHRNQLETLLGIETGRIGIQPGELDDRNQLETLLGIETRRYRFQQNYKNMANRNQLETLLGIETSRSECQRPDIIIEINWKPF